MKKLASHLGALGLLLALALETTHHAAASGYSLLYNGFESYPGGANISGQPFGSSSWTTAGVLAGDQAAISSITPFSGTNCLMISDNGANAPRATANFITGGYIPAALNKGSLFFQLREDSADGSNGDLFKVSMGHLILSRDSSNRLFFTNDQGGSKTLNFAATNYTYTPGSWNQFEVTFNNTTKQADLYINGGYATTLSGTQDYSISGITLGSYNTSSVGDKIYFDDVKLDGPYFNDFEKYTPGTNVSGLPSNTGTGTWTTAGVIAGDIAAISSNYSFHGGTNSMLLADNGSNLPSATLNFINIGVLSAAADVGDIAFSVMEDPDDAGADDGYFVSAGGVTFTRDPSKAGVFVLTLAIASTYNIQIPMQTDTYTYTPGQWADIKIHFDNIAKTIDLYVNGGYAGSQMVPIGVDPNTVNLAVSSTRLTGSRSGAAQVGDKIYYDNFSADFTRPSQPISWRSSLYPSTWTPGFADAQGRKLQDFSYAGYHSGTAAIPNVTAPIYNALTLFGADPTGTVNSTTAIQNTIDAAAAAGGGVVYLPSGTYLVTPSGTNSGLPALRISTSNIVIRGDGSDKTFIYNTNPLMRGSPVLKVSGTVAVDWYVGGTPTNLTADVNIGDTVIPVVSTAGLNIGDLIVVRNDLTQAFIDEIGNTGLPGWTNPGSTWTNRMLAFCRRVVSVTGTSVTVDVPIRYSVKTRDNGRVFKVTTAPLQEVGLENFAIGMKETTGSLGDQEFDTQGTGAYNANNSSAINISGVENCWIRNVKSFKPASNTTFHVLSNGIWVDHSRFLTIDSCDFRLSQYKGSNANGYLYTVAAQEMLLQDNHAESGRHNISIDHMFSCGNVFLRTYLKDSQNDSDFHQFYSMSNLFDSTTCDGEMIETRLRTEVTNPTPGYTSTESVFWNTKGLRYADHDTQNSIPNKGLRIIQSYQRGHGYIIGTQGPAYAVTTTNFAEGIGQGATLSPTSLYLDQRYKRLGY